MAKDVSSKTVSSTSNDSSSISDQQKVPPLRIVLNTSGNQKSSSTAVAVTTQSQQQQPQDLKRERNQDARVDGSLKPGGRVRIKLGTNKQVSKSSSSGEAADKSQTDDAPKSKGTIAERQDNIFKEELNVNYSHLRRITRRSQRSIQTVSNEDEESISSMTSTDENQNTTTNNSSDNNSGQDNAAPASSQSNAGSSTQIQSSTSNSSSTNNAETPRRYKRRKGEPSESQLSEQDGFFGLQNYKLPIQNSFELYKNIRKQVDKKLKSLNAVHPKTPYGFRDYMITRGAYLLDGNRLGNGTNLYMNEDGGMHAVPIGKYNPMRHNRVNYSVPNRAKVPLGLPVNSPLYNLFMEQEKERYRMRMQHIKEREKLTLAAEQEIVRVYNQAAMASANQLEPFSACTMLKHQEIYNYMDSDGVTIQSSEDDQLDQIKQEGVRTRRRQHEQISPTPTRKNSNNEESQPSETNQKENSKSPEQTTSGDEALKVLSDSSPKEETTKEKTTTETTAKSDNSPKDDEKRVVTDDCTTKDSKNLPTEGEEKEAESKEIGSKPGQAGNNELVENEAEIESSDDLVNKEKDKSYEPSEAKDSKEGFKKEAIDTSETTNSKEVDCSQRPCKEAAVAEESQQDSDNDKTSTEQNQSKLDASKEGSEGAETSETVAGDLKDQVVPMEQDAEAGVETGFDGEPILTDDARRAYNKEVFLSQLQDIDDKWDKIRSEMLVRHRNEAESLHAVQRLEWEWKTKEIGACDVRTTPIIDSTLVPKLNIYSQDY